jgi:hypothetical protein
MLSDRILVETQAKTQTRKDYSVGTEVKILGITGAVKAGQRTTRQKCRLAASSTGEAYAHVYAKCRS